MSVEIDLLNYLAENGQYYDCVEEIPDDILIEQTRAVERIISAPDQFPNADIIRLENIWSTYVAVCAGRLIFI